MIKYGGCSALPKNKTAAIYKSSKICISVNNINEEKYTSDRIFNILACRGFALVHYYDGIELDFENKKHLVWWKTIDEMMEYIEYYLNNESERCEIADNGYNHVWSNHKWSDRINFLNKNILKW